MNRTELSGLCREYIDMHGGSQVSKSVFVTWLCGHCKTYPRRAVEMVDEMAFHRLVSVRNGIVLFKAT